MNGNVYWHVGQETLKKAARTGPRARASFSEYAFPSVAASSMGGAFLPAAMTGMVRPPKSLRSAFPNNGGAPSAQVSVLVSSAPRGAGSAHRPSVNVLNLFLHVVHQQVLSERIGRREISFSTSNLRDPLDEA